MQLPKNLTISLRNIEFTLILLYIFSIPALPKLPEKIFNINTHNMQASEIIFILLATVQIIRILKKETSFSLAPLTLEICIYLALCALTLFVSKNISTSIVYLTKSTYLFLMYESLYNGISNIKDIIKINIAWTTSSVLVLAIGIFGIIYYLLTGTVSNLITIEHPIFKNFPRLNSTFYSSSLLGAYLIICIPITASLTGHYKSISNLKYIITLISFLILFIIGSLNLGLPIIGSSLVFWLCLNKLFPFISSIKWFSISGWTLWIITITLLTTLSFVNIRSIDINCCDISEKKFKKTKNSTYADKTVKVYKFENSIHFGEMSYLMLKRVSFSSFLKNPILGTGIGTFHETTKEAYKNGKLIKRLKKMDPHSTIFGYLSETGLIGFLGLVYLWIRFYTKGTKILKDVKVNHNDLYLLFYAPWIGTIGLLVVSINIDIMHFRFLWACLAILMSYERVKPTKCS